MSEKIVYLLGAGASAQALPMVKDSPDGSIKGLANAFREMAAFLTTQAFESKEKAFIDEQITSQQLLAEESENFTTVDTYAKHLFLTDKKELIKLKISLSLFFAIEQLYYKKRDRRYLIFLTTVMDQLFFPENIRILTWNYDFQMEITGYRYRRESIRHSNNGVTVSSPGLVQYYPPAGNVFGFFADNPNLNEFNILHLNGIAGIHNFNSTDHNGNIYLEVEDSSDDCLAQIIRHFMTDSNKKIHVLSFAWENNATGAGRHLSRKMLFAENMVKDATILVVIGYSFPFFNRQTDQAIFEKLKTSGKLKKIYFQDPYLDGSFLKSQFGLDDAIQITHIQRTDAFFVPPEL